MDENSALISKMVSFIYPLILIIGFYIIVNGHRSPGGGFHGGAVFAAVFICRYLEKPSEDLRIQTLLLFEKLLFFAIVLLPLVFLFYRFIESSVYLNIFYLVSMNLLIGLKVCAGLAIIFYRFVFYEGGSKWTL